LNQRVHDPNNFGIIACTSEVEGLEGFVGSVDFFQPFANGSKGFGKLFRVEGPEQPDLDHADLLALVGEVLHRLLGGADQIVCDR